MYGSDAGQHARSLYTKGLLPLCDIGMANMHKTQRRQDRDGLVMMAMGCSDIAPLSRYAHNPYIVA